MAFDHQSFMAGLQAGLALGGDPTPLPTPAEQEEPVEQEGE